MESPILAIAIRRPRRSWLALAVLLAAPATAQVISHERNPTVVFPAPGTYEVTLTTCNAQGCTAKTKTLTVLDPAPRIASAAAQPSPVPIGQLVTLTARATGKPPIAYRWTITPPSGSPPLSLTGATVAWPTAGRSPGTYAVDLTADSASGSDTLHAGAVILVPVGAAGFFTLPKPCRILDTRGGAPLHSSDPPRVFPASTAACAVPATAVALAANVTAVDPTAVGTVTLFPGNYPPPATSTVATHPAHPARSSFTVVSLSTDGRASLAVRFGSDRTASTHLVVDVTGYFAPSRPTPPIALAFGAPLCPTFCILPANAPLVLRYQVVGTPALYRYDWTGLGTFTESSSTPLPSHLFAAGYFSPKLQISVPGASPSAVSFAPPILATDPLPTAAPPAPTGLHATFAGMVPADPLDPAQVGPQAAFALSVASPARAGLLGWNVYLSLDGGPWAAVAALLPDLPAGTLVHLQPWDPTRHSARMALAAINGASQGPLSAPVSLAISPTFAYSREEPGSWPWNP